MPELGDAEIAQLLDEMWGNLGRTSVEAFHIGQLIREQDRFTIAPGFHEAIRVAKARGAVFVSLHQGNWELASPLLHHHGLPVAGVYQKLRNPIVDQRSNVARGPFYTLGLHSKGNETARRLLRVVGERGTVTIMADLRDLSGVNVPFFGQPAPQLSFRPCWRAGAMCRSSPASSAAATARPSRPRWRKFRLPAAAIATPT